MSGVEPGHSAVARSAHRLNVEPRGRERCGQPAARCRRQGRGRSCPDARGLALAGCMRYTECSTQPSRQAPPGQPPHQSPDRGALTLEARYVIEASRGGRPLSDLPRVSCGDRWQTGEGRAGVWLSSRPAGCDHRAGPERRGQPPARPKSMTTRNTPLMPSRLLSPPRAGRWPSSVSLNRGGRTGRSGASAPPTRQGPAAQRRASQAPSPGGRAIRGAVMRDLPKCGRAVFADAPVSPRHYVVVG